jgi:hypothetical protein
MGKLGNALILSPFATHPLDAGQRKRAYQTTALLQEWGFSITFLHFAFETRWYWGHNSEDDAVLKEQWDGDVLHFYANKKVGLPPVNGESHQLDEWWDDALGGYIANIFGKRQYDLFVVHNIWLSKAFDYAPHHCLKVLEMHDLFSQRAKEFEATGVSPEFFFCSEKDELFGLRRADLLFAIKQEDADWCIAREIGKKKVITIPYVEANSPRHPITSSESPTKPLHSGKVIFGMIGSDIHFNRHAVHKLIKELDAVIQKTYAPIEFVLAGSICRSVGECPVFVRKLGFVDHVQDFYSAVDVVMVPMLHGTGVKIKSVEALNYSKPVLFTTHSAEGTGYSGHTCGTLNEMAWWAAQISLRGAIPHELEESCRASLIFAAAWIEESKTEFLNEYTAKRPAFLQILGVRSGDLHKVISETFGGLTLYKELASIFRSNGLAVQPKASQYLVSVPSQTLGEIYTMNELIDAWKSSVFVVLSYSQNYLLDILPYEGPELLIVDCRFETRNHLLTDDLEWMKSAAKLIFIVTPLQLAVVHGRSNIEVIVFPVLTDRSGWDPHLRPLLDELKTYSNLLPRSSSRRIASQHQLALCFLEEQEANSETEYNRIALHEAILQIRDVVAVTS